MAGLDGLSLACNVLRVIDLGTRVFSAARAKYESKTGLGRDDKELISAAEDLRALVHRVDHDRSRHGAELGAGFQRLVDACDREVRELIRNLEDLGVKEGKGRSWDSFRKAWHEVVGRERNNVDRRMARLQKIQQELVTYITVASRDEQFSIFASISDLKRSNDVLDANTTSKLNDIHEAVRNINSVDGDAATHLISHLDSLAAEAKLVKSRQAILQSLTFSAIKQRQHAIPRNHAETFQWILKSDTSTFAQWLAEGDGAFWITGKPGSGKSTLMKFLATSADTRVKLARWGRGRRVVLAHFYFWLAGNAMQKSLTGLWQTLLFQILKDCPELIETVCQSRWALIENAGVCEPWDDAELLAAMQTISCLHSLPLKFCFFIDGLDEYTAGVRTYEGTYDELIRPIQAVAESPSIKICTSSRAWNFFEKAWGQSKAMLRLENCTRSDIERYVTDELGSDPQFHQLLASDDRFKDIPATIVGMADGVFLWVYLVVASLRRGLTNDDTYENLEKRIRRIPKGLNELFKNILNSIDTVYWEETSRILRTMCAAQQSLPLMSVKFLELEVRTPGSTILMPAEPLPRQALQADFARLKTRVNACCQDLLSFTEDKSREDVLQYDIDFMHRTIRDFLMLPGNESLLNSDEYGDFNPQLALCHIMLALTKAMDTGAVSSRAILRGSGRLFGLVDRLMHLALQIERSAPEEPTGESRGALAVLDSLYYILDELDRSLSTKFNRYHMHWLNIEAISDPSATMREHNEFRFLIETVEIGLTSYVRRRLTPAIIEQKRGRSFLEHALWPRWNSPIVPRRRRAVPMIRLLLELGSDPNGKGHPDSNSTTWETLLVTFGRARFSRGEAVTGDAAAILRLMIAYGADTKRIMKGDNETQLEVMELIKLMGLPDYQIEDIKTLIAEKERSQPSSSVFPFWSRRWWW